MPPASLIGDEIDGYRILRVVGKGGMGIVFEAEDISLGRSVAIKLIDPKFADEEAYLRRFRREAKALARLRSPHIVMVHALRRTSYGLFIIMEYVDGNSLSELFGGSAVAWRRIVPILRQVLLALDHAHGLGVVHRDIKPSNVMMTDTGEVRVMDFGIAKLLEHDPSATVTQEVSGSPYYMSPEQISGERDIDARTDIYSLGMTAYHLLTGRLPFDEDSNLFRIFRTVVETEVPPLRSFNNDVPDEIAAVVEKALRKPRDERYRSAGKMLAALDIAVEALNSEDEEKWTATTAVVQQPHITGSVSTGRSPRYAILLLVGVGVLCWGLWKWTTTPSSVHGQTDDITEVADTKSESDGVLGKGATLGESVAAEPETADIGVPLAEESDAPRGLDSASRPSAQAETPITQDEREQGRRDDETAVSVSADRTTEVARDLVPLVALLRVVVRQWGDVYIDGELIQENVSFAQSFELPVGSYTLSVRNPEYGTWEQRIEVAEETGAAVEVDFEKEIDVSITAYDSEGRPVRGPIFVDGRSAERWTPAAIPLRVGRHIIEVRAQGYDQESGGAINIRPADDARIVRLTLTPSDR